MQNYINGRWVGSGGGVFEDRFPGDISVVNGRFQKSTKDDARSAIKAARTAYDSWRLFDYQSRRDIFERAASIMSKRKYEMAAMVTLENGKNRYEAMADIDEAIDFLRYYSLQMRDTLGYAMDMPSPFPSERPRDLLRPYGVWGVISPFNFPWSIMAGMSTGAMIAGNTVVFKPASDAPWPALTFAEILEEAKLPPGVFNVVTGAGETVGRELVENKSISGLAFTGSKAVGTDALKTFLGVSPRLSSPRWEGRMLSSSPARQIWMKLQKVWAGQPSVTVAKSAVPALAFLVEERVADEFLKQLKEWTLQIAVGDPRQKNTFMGPLITETAIERYGRSVNAAKASGSIVIGGTMLKSNELNGYYVEPTIVTGLKPTTH